MKRRTLGGNSGLFKKADHIRMMIFTIIMIEEMTRNDNKAKPQLYNIDSTTENQGWIMEGTRGRGL